MYAHLSVSCSNRLELKLFERLSYLMYMFVLISSYLLRLCKVIYAQTNGLFRRWYQLQLQMVKSIVSFRLENWRSAAFERHEAPVPLAFSLITETLYLHIEPNIFSVHRVQRLPITVYFRSLVR